MAVLASDTTVRSGFAAGITRLLNKYMMSEVQKVHDKLAE